MKFLMTSTFYPPYHLGGDAVHVEYLAKELVKMGHEVHVFHSLDAYFVKRRQIPEKSESGGVFLHTFKTHLRVSPYIVYLLGNSPLIAKRFGILTKELKPEVVHHHNISLLGYGVLNKLGPYANLLTAHDMWLICQQNHILKGRPMCNNSSCSLCAIKHGRPPQFWRYFSGFKKAVRSIDLLIAPSNYLSRALNQSINVKSMTLANFAPFPPASIPESLFSNYFLYVGKLDKNKGIMNLLEVFARIRKKTDARLLIVGEGNLRDRIEQFIRTNSLDGVVSYVGFARGNKLYSLYSGARALIIPSVGPENSPLVALEALSVGTPVIASDMGGLSEIVSKVDHRLIFTEWTELEDILTNFSESRFLRGKTKEVYDTNFSPPAYISHYLEAIRSICARGD